MRAKRIRRRSGLRPLLRPWYVRAAALLLLVAAAGYVGYAVVPSLMGGADDDGRVAQPELSADGNTMFFTWRNQDGKATIYCSRWRNGVWQAPELVAQLDPDGATPRAILQSHLRMVRDFLHEFLARNWWWMAALAVPLGLLAAMVRWLRRVPAPVFVLVSAAIHVSLIMGCLYFFEEGVAGQIMRDREETSLTARLILEEEPELPALLPAFLPEVADLTSIESAAPAEMLRQPTEVADALRPIGPLGVPVRPGLDRQLPADRPTDRPPNLETVAAADPQSLRRAALQSMADEEPVAMLPTSAGPAPGPAVERPPEQVAVAVPQRQPADLAAGTAGMLHRTAAPRAGLPAGPGDATADRSSQAPGEPSVRPLSAPAPEPRRNLASNSIFAESPQPIETVPLANPGTGTSTGTGGVFVLPSAPVTIGRQEALPGGPQVALPGVSGPVRSIAVLGSGPPREHPGELPAIAPGGPGGGGPAASGQALPARAHAGRVHIDPETEAIATETPRGTPSLAGGASAGAGPGQGGPGAITVDVRISPSRTQPADVALGPLGPLGAGKGRGNAGLASGNRAGEGSERIDLPDPRPALGSAGNAARGMPSAAGPGAGPGGEGRARRTGRALLLSYTDTEEKIGVAQMLQLRQPEVRDDAAALLGGNEHTLAAVRLGLDWLKNHQHDDGHWSLEKFYNETKGKNYSGKGNVHSDTAATGFALLPFLGHGQTHVSGEHQATVRKGLQWLVTHQKADGDLNVNPAANTRMYAHAIATIALCEAYGMTKESTLREPAQRAVDFIVRAQNASLGAWRYEPRNDSDTSVTGWQVMALKSGQMASLEVPPRSFELLGNWLRSVQGTGKEQGQYRYVRGGNFTPAMAAEALLCLQYLGAPRDDPQLQAGIKYLLANLPKKDRDTSYYWYYATQVMYHVQGEPWRQWNAALRDMLVATQHKDGHLAGTWDPKDQWEGPGGRIYATSLRLLMLEVYYRHLPLYRVYSQ
jgi:hypothetical protein